MESSKIKQLNITDVVIYTQKNEGGVVFCTSDNMFYSIQNYTDIVYIVNPKYIYNALNGDNIKEKLNNLDNILYLDDDGYTINYQYCISSTSSGNDCINFGNKFYAVKIFTIIKDEVINLIKT